MSEKSEKKKKDKAPEFNPGAPHSVEAEQAVIAAIFQDPSLLLDVTDILKSEYFYLPPNKLVVEAFRELMAESKPIDVITVYNHLQHENKHVNAGGIEALNAFLDVPVVTHNARFWLDEVKRFWELRIVVEKCSEISARGRKVAGADVAGFLQEVESTFMEISESRISSGLTPARDIVKTTLERIESLIETPGGGVTGVPSGFVDLDSITAGYQPSDLIILAARPAMGKTAYALNVAAHAALRAEKYVALFSLEMSKEQLMQRLLATASRIHSHRFRDGQFSSEELERLYPEAAALNTDKLMIDDTPALSILELSSRCRKMKRERGCDMIIVDYLQLMTAGLAGQTSREREISTISMGLKALAKELNCPVIALAQLNRGLEQRPDKRPRPSDLRESGSIEQDADQIMFVYRDEVYHPETQEKGIAEIIIGKNRHGPTTTVKLAFQAEFTAFFNLAKVDDYEGG